MGVSIKKKGGVVTQDQSMCEELNFDNETL